MKIGLALGVALLAMAWLATSARAHRPARPEYAVFPADANALQLFWRDEAGRPFKSFRRLDAWLRKRGQRLEFAMNAGMYHADFRPVGLLVMEGREHSPLETATGKGNFYLLPNGVFFVDARGAHVVATQEFAAVAHDVRIATQSGPLLVQRGAIHPAFSPTSRSRHVRNGVGICAGRPVFVISLRKVTLHEFATYFRDSLGCADALYLDGVVSSVHVPAQGRSDAHAKLGPIIGVVEPLQER